MEDTLIVLATVSPIIAAAAGFFAGAWWTASRHVRRLEALVRDGRGTRESDDAIERIEDQLDQLREHHEFLMRAVAERNPSPPSERGLEREVTPH